MFSSVAGNGNVMGRCGSGTDDVETLLVLGFESIVNGCSSVDVRW